MVNADNIAKHAGILAAAAAVLFSLNGCIAFKRGHQLDEPLMRVSLPSDIRPGVTTKQDVLERFGPPLAVARRDTTMVLPPPGTKRGRIDMPSEIFFELFSENRPLRNSEIVYYYESTRTTALGGLVIPIIGAGYDSTRFAVKRLWILLDETTGVVGDYVFRGEQ